MPINSWKTFMLVPFSTATRIILWGRGSLFAIVLKLRPLWVDSYFWKCWDSPFFYYWSFLTLKKIKREKKNKNKQSKKFPIKNLVLSLFIFAYRTKGHFTKELLGKGAVHKRRHQFFEILTPLPPSSALLLNKLIKSKLIFWQKNPPPWLMTSFMNGP